MSRKAITICIVLIAALLLFVVYALCNLFGDDRGEESIQTSSHPDSRVNVLCAVPADAILLLESEGENLDFPRIGSSFYSTVNYLPKNIRKYKSALSLHYTAKNELSWLYISSIPIGENPDKIKKQVLDSFTYLERKEKLTTLYVEPGSGVCMAFWNNYYLLAQKQTLLESSIRHLSENTSILDVGGFAKLTHKSSGSVNLYVNHANLGKLFSGTVTHDYLKYAEFARTFATWTVAAVELNDSRISLKGDFYNYDHAENYVSVLSALEAKVPDIYEIVPSTASFVFNMSFKDVSDYLQRYRAYLESVKKYRDNPQSLKWLKTLDLQAISVVDLPFKKVSERLLFLKLGSHSEFRRNAEAGIVCDFENEDRISALFGDFFRPDAQDSYYIQGQWMLVGSQEALTYMDNFYKSSINRTFKDYLGDLTIMESVPKKSSLSLIVNPLAYNEKLPQIFNTAALEEMKEERDKTNCEYIYVDLSPDGSDKCGFYYIDIREHLKSLPSHILSKGNFEENVPENDQFTLEVDHGPFVFRNFHTQKENVLKTDGRGQILLLDHKNRVVRKHPFEGLICGTVELIDYLNNNKYQQLFAAGNKVYLMDRLGRWVDGFPKTLEKEVLLGPRVYDFTASHDYQLMVLHTDNSIGLYDRDCKRVSSWKEIQLKEKITGMPEMISVKDGIYWLVRTVHQSLIYDETGTLVADFSKKKKVSPKTDVQKISDYELELQSVAGDRLLLNLRKGTIKRK